ncbi:MAG: GNAT family N-acetyltransferase [Bacillota bacterium]
MFDISIKIETERLVLRPFDVNDCEGIFNVMKDIEMYRFTPDEPWKSIDNSREFIEMVLWLYNLEHKNFRHFFAMEEKHSGKLIGMCGIGGIEYDRAQNEIFYHIGKDYWGRGYATEAAQAMTEYAFNTLKLNRLIGVVHPDNAASIKVLEKLGMKRKGILSDMPEEHSFFNGELLFAIDNTSYKGSKAAGNEKYEAEEMGSFFDKRAEGYEEHMKKAITFDRFYSLIDRGIAATSAEVCILDIGCGTGLELEYIFKKVPNAKVTCIDLSEEMLRLLKDKYTAFSKQLEIVQGSYTEVPFAEEKYDYVISVYTMHHFLEDVKTGMYSKIYKALKPNGIYIEADYIVDEAFEKESLDCYFKLRKNLDDAKLYHIDIPFSMNTQERLVRAAGFNAMKLLYEEGYGAIFAAGKSEASLGKIDKRLTILKYRDEYEEGLSRYASKNVALVNSVQLFLAVEADNIAGYVCCRKPNEIIELIHDDGRDDVRYWLHDVATDYFDRCND